MDNNVVVTSESGVIRCNFDEIKEYLNGQLDVYKHMVFTEDSKKDAKNTVAELRKQKKDFSDRVKAVKAEYMKPYDDFYGKACELMDMWDEPICFINNQIQEFEEKRIQEKREKIDSIYAEFIGDMSELIPLKNIWNPKWENATYSEKQIKDDMYQVKETVKSGLEAIKSQHSDVEETAIRMFLVGYDLSQSLLFMSNHEKQKAEILAREQERIRREEEERIRQEERRRIEAERRAEEEKQREIEQAVLKAKEEAAEEVIASFIPADAGAPTSVFEYHITLSEEQKEKLEIYMDSIGIEYETMPVF